MGGSGGIITYDTTQKVNGVGSYKFDSDDGDNPHVTVPLVMGATRRASVWFRYSSVPDATSSVAVFAEFTNENYSGGGFYEGEFQVETATIVGTITGSGNATFTVTTNLEPSPIDVSVAVLVDDTAADVATKAAVALNGNALVAEHFIATANGADLVLTVRGAAPNDNDLNISYTNDTCTGLTPDATSEDTVIGGFASAGNENLGNDDGNYGRATPAKNAGQGAVFGNFGLAFLESSAGLIPNEAAIKAVKIRYERKYNTADSIGISRVKYRLDGAEGPDHDNTDVPLTDTFVEVDVTGDRDSWARDELADFRFEVIAEARRGDTDTAHTQSWDYVEVEVEYFIPTTILAPSGSGIAFEFALIPRGDHVTLRLIDGDKVWYDGITELLPDTDHRISWAHVLHDTNLVDIKLYVDSIQELDIVDAKCAGGAANLVNLLHGWVGFPGVNKVCHFDQLYIDDGNDLTDCGNKYSTAKLPTTPNDDDWDTDGGTGAVNERPLSETNYKQHQADFDPQRQTYALQAANVGDIDISGETLVGLVGWAWAKFEANFDQENIKLITNGVEVNRTGQLAATPKLIIQPITSPVYPSNARGIGMLSNSETTDTTMYKCGVVMVYEGPLNPNVLFEHQQVNSETLPTITDDLRADPPSSYEVCCDYDDFDGSVQIVIHSLDQDGGSVLPQPGLDSKGRVRIVPGVEVYLDVTVTGVTNLQIWRRLNVD